jgi:hypothetical protein
VARYYDLEDEDEDAIRCGEGVADRLKGGCEEAYWNVPDSGVAPFAEDELLAEAFEPLMLADADQQWKEASRTRKCAYPPCKRQIPSVLEGDPDFCPRHDFGLEIRHAEARRGVCEAALAWYAGGDEGALRAAVEALHACRSANV